MTDRPKLKIVELYHKLLVGGQGLDENSWLQFFLLEPQKDAFEKYLMRSNQDYLFSTGRIALREIFKRSLRVASGQDAARRDIKGKGKVIENGQRDPSDERNARLRSINGMRMIVLIIQCLCRRGLRDGEVVELITDLEDADSVFNSLLQMVKSQLSATDPERQHQAVRFIAMVAASSPQSTIVARFMDKDLFDLLVGMVETPFAYEALLALEILSHHHRFEKRNVHVSSIEKLTNVNALNTWIGIFGKTFERGISAYEEAGIGEETKSTLDNIQRWVQRMSLEESRSGYDHLPLEECAITLGLYDLVYSNRKFASEFVCQGFPAKVGGHKSFFPKSPPPLTTFLVHSSYLFTHVYKERAKYYSRLALIIILCLVEDDTCAKFLGQAEYGLELCRERSPLPPLSKTKERPILCSIIDLVANYINLNLKRRLDIDAYIHCATILHRILVHLKSTSTRLIYHWSFLFTTLTTCSQFLVNPANLEVLQALPGYHSLIRSLITLYNLAISYGDTFLPDAKSLDDLFYECLRNGALLDKLGLVGGISIRTGQAGMTVYANPPGSAASSTGSTDITNLRIVYSHFHTKILEYRTAKRNASWLGFANFGGKSTEGYSKATEKPTDEADPMDMGSLSANEVLKVIQSSYDNLELKEVKDLDTARKYLGGEVHEAGFFKSLVRFVILDINALIPDVITEL